MINHIAGTCMVSGSRLVGCINFTVTFYLILLFKGQERLRNLLSLNHFISECFTGTHTNRGQKKHFKTFIIFLMHLSFNVFITQNKSLIFSLQFTYVNSIPQILMSETQITAECSKSKDILTLFPWSIKGVLLQLKTSEGIH